MNDTDPVQYTSEGTRRHCGTCGHENAEHFTYPGIGERECYRRRCDCSRFTELRIYGGPVCSNPSTAGDWCGECAGCIAAVAWIRQQVG